MRSHPGGKEHTLHLLELAGLREGDAVLDMGAGDGEAVLLMRSMGIAASGIDLEPRSPDVEQGDMLRTSFPDRCFDAVLSQCSFFASFDQPGALREACRLLRRGGKLLLSDVFFSEPEKMLRDAGFDIVCSEDMTELWLEYYLEALWRDESPCCDIPKGKSRYFVLIGRKD
ncbi:MAG: class I SAM-dependent methyltransferase [Oscillospiraceae bacterium]|nr:class I SAM-dependent methyltransferase [Oscillospiraceae bacterium]